MFFTSRFNKDELFPEPVIGCFYNTAFSGESEYLKQKREEFILADKSRKEPKLLINGREEVSLYKPTVLTTETTFKGKDEM